MKIFIKMMSSIQKYYEEEIESYEMREKSAFKY